MPEVTGRDSVPSAPGSTAGGIRVTIDDMIELPRAPHARRRLGGRDPAQSAGNGRDEPHGSTRGGGARAVRLDTTAVAVRVLRDRRLVVGAWQGGAELGRYSSDPSREPGADEEVLAAPVGAEPAEASASFGGRVELADELEVLLAEELDPDSFWESERLAVLLGTLGMLTWLGRLRRLTR